MKQIIAHITLDGGALLSASRVDKIFARATVPTDHNGNSLRDGKEPYYQRWKIKKEDKGYIFREISSNSGICGHHPTVRQLVVNTLVGPSGCSGRIVVEVMP